MATAVALPAVAATGCTLSGPTPQSRPTPRSTEQDPDVALLSRVSAQTAGVVALYEAVVERHRGLRTDLRPLLAAHRAHAGALGDAAPPTRGGRSGRSGRSGPNAGEPPPPVDVPRGEAQAVRRLRRAERDSAARLLEATRQARSGQFARLLASMSAASAQHVQVLRGVGTA